LLRVEEEQEGRRRGRRRQGKMRRGLRHWGILYVGAG
jgi:hypothetical protein